MGNIRCGVLPGKIGCVCTGCFVLGFALLSLGRCSNLPVPPPKMEKQEKERVANSFARVRVCGCTRCIFRAPQSYCSWWRNVFLEIGHGLGPNHGVMMQL